MVLKRLPSLFRFWPSTAQGGKKLMGKLPNVLLQAGWDRCLHLEGIRRGNLSSSLHPACILDVDFQDAEGS